MPVKALLCLPIVPHELTIVGMCRITCSSKSGVLPAGLRLSNLDVKALQAIFELLQVRIGLLVHVHVCLAPVWGFSLRPVQVH